MLECTKNLVSGRSPAPAMPRQIGTEQTVEGVLVMLAGRASDGLKVPLEQARSLARGNVHGDSAAMPRGKQPGCTQAHADRSMVAGDVGRRGGLE